MHADIGDVASGGDDGLAQLKGLRHADGLNGDVHAFAECHGHGLLHRTAIAGVDEHGGTEFFGDVESAFILVDHDDVRRCIKTGREQRREADGTRADDGDGVAGLHAAIQHAAFIAGGQDVTEHDHGLLISVRRDGVQARICPRDAHMLCLRAVNGVAENPAAVLAVRAHATAAKFAFSAGGDAGDDHAVTHMKAGDAAANLFDDAGALVAEDATFGDAGHVSFEDVQIRAADGGLRDANDGIRRILQGGLWHVLEAFRAGAVVNECFHIGINVRLVHAPRRSTGCCRHCGILR